MKKDSPNVYAFKESKNSYYIVQVDYWSEDELKDSLDNIKASIKSKGINEPVDVIDLMKFCNAREQIKQGKNLRVKNKGEISCYICD
jgi:hypothetical protein